MHPALEHNLTPPRTTLNGPMKTAHLVNISPLARRLGIPIHTAITPELVACYGQSPQSVAHQPAWLWDLLWTARRAMAGLLPCRRESTEVAELYHIECSTFFSGRLEPEPIRCCVALSGDEDGDVRLIFRLAPPQLQLLANRNLANKNRKS